MPLLLAGCKGASSAPETGTAAVSRGKEQTFPVRGRVVSVEGSSIVLDHDAVPGFMGAMTMEYKVADANIASELHPGDRINATIHAEKDSDGFRNPHLTDIVVTGQARPDYLPKVQYHVPVAGDSVPDFKLLNQSGHTIHLHQFRGEVLLLTFIYTRCNLADFCPRMSRNFAEINQQLQSDPKLYAETHLLSISFDPEYDTPAVLRSYGGAYTGRYTQEKFTHWDFAAPPEKELPALTQFFDVGVTPGSDRSKTHSLSTVLIGKDGKVLDWYPTNEWKPADVLKQMAVAASA